MTFDDGLLKIYNVSNVANNGEIPKKGLSLRETAYFQELNVGVTRHYEAIKAGAQIDLMVAVYYDVDVITDNIVIVNDEDGQYRVSRIENDFDQEGIKIKKLTLIDNGVERYEIIDDDDGTAQSGSN